MLDQPFERRDMRVSEVADMDIVADAGAVGRGIVGAVDGDLALADRRFARDLDEVRRALRRSGLFGPRVGAGDVEIAKRSEVEWMRGRCVRSIRSVISFEAP